MTDDLTQARELIELHLMERMHDGATLSFGPTEICYNLAFFTDDTITRDLARALLRGLTDRGFCRYHRGLWSEDGEPMGAGYGLTEKGVAHVRATRGEVSEDA